jgi:hypothetical protein
MVTVTLKPGRDGAPIGLITTVLLPNGHTLSASGPETAGARSTPAQR